MANSNTPLYSKVILSICPRYSSSRSPIWLRDVSLALSGGSTKPPFLAPNREMIASVKHHLSRDSSIPRHCKFGVLTHLLRYDKRNGISAASIFGGVQVSG